MKSNIIILIFTIGLLASCGYKRQTPPTSLQEAGRNDLPKNTKLISTTPIKNQGESNLAWMYAMLGTIESEHIMKGDSVNLSPAYLARMMLQEKALEYYFANGKKEISMNGMASMLIHYIDKYGAQPYDSYEDPKDINYHILCRKIEHICDGAIAKKTGVDNLKKQLDELFDQELGYMPAKQVHMLGAEYTPLEFAHSVCYPEEYVALTSFSHHPFREYLALEVPNNQLHDEFLNLPLDELMLHILKAVEKGHPACWEGSFSESNLQPSQGYYIDIPMNERRPVSQAIRQREFEQLHTTADYAMVIIGTFLKQGQRYYVCRNSKGKSWGNQGLVYLSEDYLRLNTIAVYMSEEAYIYDKKL